MSSTPTHRVLRPFPVNGEMLTIGSLISDEDWTPHGRANVEGNGYVARLTPAELAQLAPEPIPAPVEEPVAIPLEEELGEISDGLGEEAIAPEPVAEKPVKKATVKKAPAKKATAKKATAPKTPTSND